MCSVNTAFGYIYNFIFWLTGATLIAVGTYATIDVSSYIDLIGKNCIAVALLYIGVGCLVIISSFLGGFSASSDNKIWVKLYMALLWIIFLMELSGAIVTIILRDDIGSQTETQLETTIVNYYSGTSTSEVKTEWDNMQINVQCCGANNFTDWFQQAPYYVPTSCCNTTTSETHCQTIFNTTDPKNYVFIYQEGCIDKVSDQLTDYANLVWLVGFIVAFVTILGILLYCCLQFRACKQCFRKKAFDPSNLRTTNA